MNKMNVRLAVLVACMAVSGLLLVACGDNTSTAAPAATTTSATTPATTTQAVSATTAAVPTTVATVNPIATATPMPSMTPATTAAPATTQAATTAAATTAAPTTASANTPTSKPAEPATTAAATTAATTTSVAGGTPPALSGTPADTNKDLFLDDRSNAIQVLRSFYNAINRKEYVRAYSYYAANTTNFPAYQQFADGYKDTATVELFVGSLTGDVGAGSVNYSVPFSLKSTNNTGAIQVFAGCYDVHGASDPKIIGAPPFGPLNIDSAKVQAVQAGGNVADVMAKSCPSTDKLPTDPITSVPNDDSAVDAKYFLDDRSTPASIIRSFYNAINRKEYVRAYSYFVTKNATTPPPAYDQFAAGYKNTATVQLATGTITSGAGAGQVNYGVPVKLTVKNADGSTQTFSGNYELHKAQPANFGTPPFEPLGISGANIK